jgi:hypothetical protein
MPSVIAEVDKLLSAGAEAVTLMRTDGVPATTSRSTLRVGNIP